MRAWAHRQDCGCALTHTTCCDGRQGGSEWFCPRVDVLPCFSDYWTDASATRQLVQRANGASAWATHASSSHGVAYSTHARGHQRRDGSATTLPWLGSEGLICGITTEASHTPSVGSNDDVLASDSIETAKACLQMAARASGRGGVARDNPFEGPLRGAWPESASTTSDDWSRRWGIFSPRAIMGRGAGQVQVVDRVNGSDPIRIEIGLAFCFNHFPMHRKQIKSKEIARGL
jgi:hypothetical protein